MGWFGVRDVDVDEDDDDGGREDVERRDIEGRRYKICPAGIHSIPNRAHTRHAIPSRAICRYQICRPAGTDIIANNV